MSSRVAVEAAPSPELGLRFFDRMLRARNVEDEVQRMFTQGLVRGTTHLCQGQEAVSVGVCGAMAAGDTMTCTYRGHGAVLAMGAAPDAVFGEIMGKANGLCGGKGGSMHLTDVRVGAYGSFSIVGVKCPAPDSPYTAAVEANTSAAPSRIEYARISFVYWKLLSIM